LQTLIIISNILMMKTYWYFISINAYYAYYIFHFNYLWKINVAILVFISVFNFFISLA